MSTHEVSQESRRFATGQDGVLHEVVRFLPRHESYVAACGANVPARTANVFRTTEPPGILCRRCAAAS